MNNARLLHPFQQGLSHPLGTFLLLLLGALAPACASSGLLTSLDDLTAHVDRKGLLSLEQQRVLSLSGLIPDAPPGSIYRYQNKRSPFTAIGISVHDAKCGPNCTREPDQHTTKSFIVERAIQCKLTLPQLVALRNQLLEARRLGAKLIRLRLERLVLQSQKEQLLAQEESDSEEAAQQTQISALGSKIRSLSTAIDKEEDLFEAAIKGSQEGIQSQGVMVVRAETKRTLGLTGRLASLFTGGARKEEEQAGFAILAGLRTMRLFVGQDLLHDVKNIATDWYLIGRRFPFLLGVTWRDFFGLSIPIPYPGQLGKKDFYITTARLEAKTILYAQDSLTEKSIRADVKASQDAIRNLGELGEAERLEVELVLGSVESLGSSAILGQVHERQFTVETYRRRLHSTLASNQVTGLEFEGDEEIGDTGTGTEHETRPLNENLPEDDAFSDSDDWITVYAVMSEVDDLETLLRNHLRPHLTALF